MGAWELAIDSSQEEKGSEKCAKGRAQTGFNSMKKEKF